MRAKKKNKKRMDNMTKLLIIKNTIKVYSYVLQHISQIRLYYGIQYNALKIKKSFIFYDNIENTIIFALK